VTPDFNTLTVRTVRKETPGAVTIVFDVPEALADAYRFDAGQYLTVRREFDGVEERRSYSVCSGTRDNELRIAVKRQDGGTFSTFANDVLAAGDPIEVMRPRGRFTAQPEPGARRLYLAIAAGSGITPVLSIVKTLLVEEPASEIILVYGNRDSRSIMFKSELEDLKDRYLGRLTLLNVLTREHQDAPLLNGRIDAAKIGTVLQSLRGRLPDVAYLCGPLPLMKLAREALEDHGLPRERIRTEIFTAQGGAPRPAAPAATRTAEPDAAPVATLRVTLHGRENLVPMAAGETVLDAATRAGLEAPFSCRGGMCCTCRAKLTDGTVDMAVNYSLEPWELEAGFVLTCQSRPTTPSVAVDYDAH
jgi:ring-1,2-phenylacetyl-CoA epoxidase subunit PaaE